MFYVLLAVQIVLVAAFVVFAVRWFRVAPEARRVLIFPTKRKVLGFLGFFVVIGTIVFSAFGVTGIRVSSAAKDYLHEQYGESETWKISLSHHVVRSKAPPEGTYRIHFHYAGREGDLVADYAERDGKFTTQFASSPK